MTEAIFMLGGLGVVVGLGLAVASKMFYVYVDPKIVAVDDALPGANCGGCGYPGCMSNAEAIVAGTSEPNSCVAAGDETTEEVAAVMGVSIEAKEPDIARPGCTYGTRDAELKYIYEGLGDCRAAALFSGGMKVCNIGCLGLGSCEKACQFGAVSMGPEGLPVVNDEKCTGCGACERTCPKHIITLSSTTRRIIKEYTTQDCSTPCQRSCPAGIDICEYIRQISLGDYHRSAQIIKERNPFPTVIGRICPRPCETECRRQFVDEPVAVNYLKRFVADYEKNTGDRVIPFKAPETGRRIAVVGGGVAGLSAAFFTARLGHDVTLFEAQENLGGLLRTAIAKNRLPLDILDWDIQGVLEMGIKSQTNQTMGKDFTIDALLEQGFEIAFLATGGWDSRLSRGSNSQVEKPIPGLYLLIDLLKSGPGMPDMNGKIDVGDDVIIAGGGNSACRAAKQLKGSGVENITIIYRKTENESPGENHIDADDLDEMRREGIRIIFNAGVDRLRGRGADLTHVDLVNLTTKNRERISARSIFIASGRFPHLIFSRTKTKEVDTDASGRTPLIWEAYEPYKDPAYADKTGWLATGDTVSDFSNAIRAIGAGRRAAASIHQTLYDIPLTLPENVLTPLSMIQNVDHVEQVDEVSRRIMPLSGQLDIPPDPELEKGFTEEMAKDEAKRCLRCGLTCYQHNGVITLQGQTTEAVKAVPSES